MKARSGPGHGRARAAPVGLSVPPKAPQSLARCPTPLAARHACRRAGPLRPRDRIAGSRGRASKGAARRAHIGVGLPPRLA